MKLPVGVESFEKIRQNKAYYIDKTDLICRLLKQKENEVTLFTRPRRFGKTLTMTMLDSFFDITRDSREMFEGLKVAEDKELCREWMNQYPVVFVSLKDVEGADFEDAYSMLEYTLAMLYGKYEFLLKNDGIAVEDKTAFRRLRARGGDKSDVKGALCTLMRMLHVHYGRQVILLIDEYDVPLAKAKDYGYYEHMLHIIRGILSMALKTNLSLKFAVLTGCLRIVKESIFTGVNNFVSYSVLSREFGDIFGFTEEEVKGLLSDAGLSDKSGLVREWYDGYHFGDSAVYCPWDVVSYASAAIANPDTLPMNYWINTSSNSIIRSFIDKTEYAVSRKFETLLNGGTIQQDITDELTYDQLYDSEQNLWSILLMTGYLTKADIAVSEGAVCLKIPNREITSVFQSTVVNWFRDTLQKDRQQEMFDALWNGDEERATGIISDFLWNTISFHDYHEDFYHAFIAGIFVGAGYETESNREHGPGRTDVLVIDAAHRRVLLIETKKSDSADHMEKDCMEAITQIREKQYAKEFEYGYQQILCYGISFYKKQCLVKKSKK
ncbi:MAG: AAA family ATPase [Lachnospiraceae bacterium]|nr:AAA family ATPase [Lachnospiraceae bacterium]